MPKVSITDAKGLVQSTGTGFEAESLPKAVYEVGASMTKLTVIRAAAADSGRFTGGKYFVIHGKTSKYQFYFSSVGTVVQTVPTAIAGHTLVSIADIDADEATTDIGPKIVTAVNTVAELSSIVGHGDAATVCIASLVPQLAAGVDHRGNLATADLTIAVQKTGAGDGTLALRPGAVNHIAYGEMGHVNFSAINQDHADTSTIDGQRLALADGDYAGQEVTIVRTSNYVEDAISSPAVLVDVVSSRALDGGANVSNQILTFENSAHLDGSPLLRGAWDGVAWQWFTIGAVAHYGVAGLQDGD